MYLAATTVMAAEAEQIRIQHSQIRTLRLDSTVSHVVVGDTEVLEARIVATNVVELKAKNVGRAMLLVWTESQRLVFIITVEPAPIVRQSSADSAHVRQPATTTGQSLYFYRGTVIGSGRGDIELRNHRHQINAYQPIGSGAFAGNVGFSGKILPRRPNLDTLSLRYHDALWSLQLGDAASPTSPGTRALAAHGSFRGAVAEYDDTKLAVGLYGGFEPGGDHPYRYIDVTRPIRAGLSSGFTFAPNAEIGLDAVHRSGFSMVTRRGNLRDSTTTLITPSLRWEPSDSLGIYGSGGISPYGQAYSAGARFDVPVLGINAGYTSLGDRYQTRASRRRDFANVGFALRPSRLVSVWTNVSRVVQEGHALFGLGGEPLVAPASDSQSLQLSLIAEPIFDHFSIGLSRTGTEAPETRRELGDATTSAGIGSTLTLPETKTQIWDAQLFANRSLGDALGKVAFRGRHARSFERSGPDIRRRLAYAGDLSWYPPALGVLSYNMGFSVASNNIDLRSRDTGTATKETTTQYDLRQEFGLSLDHIYAFVLLGLSRQVTEAQSTDFLNTSARLVFRPTQAHEIFGEFYVSNQLLGARKDGGAVATTLLDQPSNYGVLLSYAFYFGEAVDAPSIFDFFYQEGIRVETFLDANENGLRDPSEEPLELLTASLDDRLKFETDEDGIAEFDGLTPGGHQITVDINGAGARYQGLRFTTASSLNVVLEPGETKVVEIGLSDRGRVFGSVYNDFNLDGAQQGHESGFPNIVVKFHRGGIVVGQTRTSESGEFRLGQLAPGKYKVSFHEADLPPEHQAVETEAEIRVGPSELARVTFPVKAFRSIEGVVFIDRNDNGIKDAGEQGLSDAMVHWDGKSVKSNGGGKYLMRSLPAGTFEVWIDPISLPPGLEPAGRIPLTLPPEPTNVKLDIPVRRARRLGEAEGSEGNSQTAVAAGPG